MALHERIITVSYEAAGPLEQFTICTIDTTAPRTVRAAVAADAPLGVVYNKPQAAGHATTVVTDGIVRVRAGSAIDVGDEVGVDANSLATAVVGAGGALGTAITAGETGEIVEVQIL